MEAMREKVHVRQSLTIMFHLGLSFRRALDARDNGVLPSHGRRVNGASNAAHGLQDRRTAVRTGQDIAPVEKTRQRPTWREIGGK